MTYDPLVIDRWLNSDAFVNDKGIFWRHVLSFLLIIILLA